MYVTRIESTVIPGKQREFEAFLDQVYALSARAPGFRLGGTVSSTAFPGRHIGLALWENAAAATASRRSDAVQNLLASNPPSALVTPVRPAEGYEVVCRVQDRPTAEAGAAILLDLTIDQAQATAYEGEMQQRLDLRLKFGHGLVSNTLCRALSGGGRYLLYFVHTDEAALLATQNAPEVRAAREARPPSSFGGQITGADRGSVLKIVTAALVA